MTTVDAWYCQCGTYCPNATLPYQHPLTCPVGYYCPVGGYLKQTFPVPCPAGHLCSKTGLCVPPGCPCGFYCPKGSSAALPCGVGTYSAGNSSKCTACDPANLCAQPETCKPQCPSPQCNPLDQPPGFVCYNDPVLGCSPVCVEPSICGTTPPTKPPTTAPGGINRQVSTTPAPYTCGYYVPPGFPQSPAYEQPCRSGYYCPLGPTPSTPIVPVKCPGGYYCGRGTCTPLNCTCGFKCPAGSSAPIECQPPYYCPNQLATSQTLCPIGYKCDQPGLCAPTPCPPGTFVTCAGKVSCDACAKGRYCPTVTTTVLCPAGYYCPGGVSAPTPCTANHYCHLGSAEPIHCPDGKTSPAGSSSKSQCT